MTHSRASETRRVHREECEAIKPVRPAWYQVYVSGNIKHQLMAGKLATGQHQVAKLIRNHDRPNTVC